MIATYPPPVGKTKQSKKNQVFFVLFVLFVVVAWNVGYYFLSQVENVPLWDYQGTSGPIALVLGTSGEYEQGGPTTSVKPGGVFGWISSLCVHPGVSGLGVSELFRKTADGEETLDRIETPIPVDGSRCGPKVSARLVPPDAPVGYYEVRRQLLLTVQGHPRPIINLPSLHIRVER